MPGAIGRTSTLLSSRGDVISRRSVQFLDHTTCNKRRCTWGGWHIYFLERYDEDNPGFPKQTTRLDHPHALLNRSGRLRHGSTRQES